MLTGFQNLLSQGEAFLESADGGTVQLSIAPGIDVCANVGQFRRERYMEGSGYQWIEYGTIIIRRCALAEAGITAEPDAGQNVVANGKTYRIKFCAPDSTAFTLDCVNIY